VQEIVSNAIKHAEGDHIMVKFISQAAGDYQLSIADNGKGFNVNEQFEGHYGMENIQKRAKEVGARLTITSEPGKSTTVVINKDKNTPFGLLDIAAASATFTG
jgi:two-component system vancomycin resistance sensor histidine kinase VraS